MKILIVGFGRCGTTLTFRIYGSHPSVKKALLETCILSFYKDKQHLIKKNPFFNKTCCEKVIYSSDNLGKKAFGKLDISITDYCEMWLDWFKDEARIVQLIRHPTDTVFSLIAKRGRKMGIISGFEVGKVPEKERERLTDAYFNVVPKYPKMIAALPQTLTVKYEDIITNKKTIKRMYEFCNLVPYLFPEKLRTRRVFGYKKSGFVVDRPVIEIVKTFNKICKEGVKYHDQSSRTDVRRR